MKYLTIFTLLVLTACATQKVSNDSSIKTIARDDGVDVIEPSMVLIKSGEFKMGSDTLTPTKLSHTPAHTVKIESFYMSKYEVTVGEFAQFVEATNHKMSDHCWKWKSEKIEYEMTKSQWDSHDNAPSKFHPVMCIGWEDAKAYAHWLSERTGKYYRLPTEAEWEYVLRSGTYNPYYFGDNIDDICLHSNVLDRSGVEELKKKYNIKRIGVNCDDGFAYTSVVGLFAPNSYGVYDMLGNVGEYVEDCQHDGYDNAPIDGSAWVSDCVGHDTPVGFFEMVIRRGGSYSSSADSLHSYSRAHTGKTNPSGLGEGFRLVREIRLDSGYLPSNISGKTRDFLNQLKNIQNAFRNN